jgi:hypothetical protein
VQTRAPLAPAPLGPFKVEEHVALPTRGTAAAAAVNTTFPALTGSSRLGGGGGAGATPVAAALASEQLVGLM